MKVLVSSLNVVSDLPEIRIKLLEEISKNNL